MSAKYYGIEKIGEEFEYKGKKYRVLLDDGGRCRCCCDMESVDGACHEMACMPFLRDDERSVFYYRVDRG